MFPRVKYLSNIFIDTSNKHHPINVSLKRSDNKNENSTTPTTIKNRIQTLKKSITRSGVHTVNYMSAMGFEYTGNEDTARCKHCGLEVSNWTLDMNPFTIHSKQQPNCPFILSLVTKSPLCIHDFSISSSTTTGEHISKRQKVETIDSQPVPNTLFESNSLQQARRRTFSHWPSHTVPSSAEMIEAGFFNCNVGNRVICIYCNLICQQWTSHVDDPREVHKTLSPNCIYVKAKLMNHTQSSIIIINEQSTTTDIDSSQTNNLDSLRSNCVVFRTPCNSNFSEIPKRYASFSTWSSENSPSVDALVQAGFFYSGRTTIVTCFYCNGSLQNWGPNDNPIIEHARWFPSCSYAKQLCGEDLFRKIQESKRINKEQAKSTERTGSNSVTRTNLTTNSGTLMIPDESTLSRLVAARLDLPISQRLLDQNFQLSIIKRCWEDQLRIKRNDFVSDTDLYVACLILRKQIEYIGGKKENIIIPSIKMKQIREQSEIKIEKPMPIVTQDVYSVVENSTDVEMTISSQSSIKSRSNDDELKIEKPTIDDRSQSTNSSLSNPCALCLTEEKQLACIPCGHMVTCVACGHSLSLCPICRREINAFARIYI
ncbi:unnamed protein product [Rotaria sp. Silwood2]|nr:unnamed protein product [Rotaria sp. Silwood2]CAF4272762.1 unnamed protein product [Rotaria sp. Silwood2]